MTTGGNPRRWADAFDQEIAEVERRHIGHGPARQNLVGLAFSGGGIRSATFGLGVLEGLKPLGLLKHVHYLSTVSGGGYIGAWLSANCKRAAERRAVDPTVSEWLDPAADWTASIAHLRRYSNYLSPKVGFFSADTWTMFMIWIRNTLLVQFTVILGIALALLAPRLLVEGFHYWPKVGHWRWTTVALFLLGIVGIAGNQLRLNTLGNAPLLQAKSWRTSLVYTGLCVLAAWVIGAHFDFDPFTGGPIDYRPAVPIALLLVGAGFWFQPAAVKALSVVWPGKNPPQQINYTQAWAQATIVLPMMATGYLVAAILWGQSQSPAFVALKGYGELFRAAASYWPFPLSVIFASLWLLSFCSIRSRTDWKGLLAALFAPLPALLVLHALLCVIMLLLHGWARNAEEGAWTAFVWTPAMVLYAFSLTIVVLIGIMGRQSTDGVREWWSRLGAWLGIYAFAWMVVAVVAIYGPRGAVALAHAHPWTALWAAGGGWLGTTVAGLFAGHSGSTGGGDATEKGAKSNKVLEVIAQVAPFVFIAGLLIAVSVGLDYVILIDAGYSWPPIKVIPPGTGDVLTVSLLVGAACLAALILMAARVDINEFGLNAFYRNRLVRCYLGASRYLPGERKPQNFTGFDDNDDMKLTDLRDAGHPSAGPLHIVNCALNLGGSSDLALHTRHSATFTLSPLQCGSSYESKKPSGAREELGYISTERYGGKDGAPTLGQAISVSGAAASPNMGYHTSPVVAFLLTVFNVRLGWWFPNPRRSATNLPSPYFNLTYLLKELFGGANDKSTFLMISDGGHFENLAAYELVRRRCRVIIISDGEADPRLRFEGLGTLIRMCEVDFGAKIALDVGSIRPGSGQMWSTSRCAVGHIDYGPEVPSGTLIYLKASMTGREDTSVLQYKASHPDFPHESTANQFYKEDQFESYRHLGREIASLYFGPVSHERDFVALAAKLHAMGSPTPGAS